MKLTTRTSIQTLLFIAMASPALAQGFQKAVPHVLEPDLASVYHLADNAVPPTTAPADGWQLSLSFPVWIAGVSGDLVVKGTEFSPDQDTGDVIDLWDTHLNAAAVAHFEASKSRFGIIVDGMYVDLRTASNLRDTDRYAELKGFVGELDAFYTVVPSVPGKKGWGTFRLDALAGVRVSALEVGLRESRLNLSANVTLFDPIVGARLQFGLTDWLSFKLRGDVGGFGIAAWSSSDFAYNVETGFDFHLASWFDLGVGYRWLKYDFVSNSGTSSFDATLSGPYLALQFNF